MVNMGCSLNRLKLKPTLAGHGVNDSAYKVTRRERVDGKSKLVWSCPYYRTWKQMISRCYTNTRHAKEAYKDCYVCEEWLLFSNFRAWMVEQDWEGLQLDKDILVLGNKVYSPDTCVFVSKQVNTFLLDRSRGRGEYLIGVNFCKKSKKFQSHCSNPFTNKQEYLGCFDCEIAGHKAWLFRKLEHAKALASTQTDQRVAEALIERYLNYEATSGKHIIC